VKQNGDALPSNYRVCCVGRGLCDRLIPRPEESYWVWCVWVWSDATV